jgi:hypothetical protein
MGRDKLNGEVKIDDKIIKNRPKNVQNGDWKKPTVRDFSDPFFAFLITFGPYTDLSKNRPHKKHCAWARTPPWDFL